MSTNVYSFSFIVIDIWNWNVRWECLSNYQIVERKFTFLSLFICKLNFIFDIRFFDDTPIGSIMNKFAGDSYLIDDVSWKWSTFSFYSLHNQSNYAKYTMKPVCDANNMTRKKIICLQRLSATFEGLLRVTIFCVATLLFNMAVNPYFIVPAVPIVLIYYGLEAFFRKSLR